MNNNSVIEKLDEKHLKELGWLERLLCSLIRFRFIFNCDRDIYLRRWFLFRSEPVAVFLHKFERSDEDRYCHDHPWDFLVIPIWRGYIEHWERPVKCVDCKGSGGNLYPYECQYCKGQGFLSDKGQRRVWPILGIRFRRAEYRHRVELFDEERPSDWKHRKDEDGYDDVTPIYKPLPSWSIFIRFRKRRVWGFWTGVKKFIDNRTFWKINCED